MQPSSLLVIETVISDADDAVRELEVDEVAIGQIGGFIEEEASVPDLSLQRLHQQKLTTDERHLAALREAPGLLAQHGECVRT